MHSATKYLGGHSDISAGVSEFTGTHRYHSRYFHQFRWNLSSFGLVVRTKHENLALRVAAQTMPLLCPSGLLHKQSFQVYTLTETHPHHQRATAQMNGL